MNFRELSEDKRKLIMISLSLMAKVGK